jgi:Ser/Thr protein kinase RdoA (MazF antagonist)
MRSRSHASLERPFEGLTPTIVVDAVESVGFRSDGRVLALGSYENRVYQVGLEGAEPLVAKFYRPGRWSDEAIGEEHAFSRELAAAEIPVVAPLERDGVTLFRLDSFRFALFPRRGGRWPELATADEREWMGRFLGRMHAVGAVRTFRHRPTLSVEAMGRRSVEFLLTAGFVPDYIRDRFSAVANEAVRVVEQQFRTAGAQRTIRLHGDCHRGNVLWTEAGPHFVDLDDCMSGPAIQDLWMLVAGDASELAAQMADLLRGYRRFLEFDERQLELLESLRTLRLIHYNAWIARRWHDPAFPLAFPWFGEPRYWETATQSLQDQIDTMVRDAPG